MGLIFSTRQFGFLSGLFAGKIRDNGLDLKLKRNDKLPIIDAASNFVGLDKELNLEVTVKPKLMSSWKAILNYHFNLVSDTYSLLNCKIVLGNRLTIDGITSLNAKTKLLNLVDSSTVREIEDYLENEAPNNLPETILQIIKEHLNSWEGRKVRGRTSLKEDYDQLSKSGSMVTMPKFEIIKKVDPTANDGALEDIQKFYNEAAKGNRLTKYYKISVDKFKRDELVVSVEIELEWVDIKVTYIINPQTNQIKVKDCSIFASKYRNEVAGVNPQNWLKKLKSTEDEYYTNERDKYVTLYETLTEYEIGREDIRNVGRFFKQEYNKTLPTFLINILKQYKQERGL
jgi:hypothetical protein